jgi:hypothetical protein
MRTSADKTPRDSNETIALEQPGRAETAQVLPILHGATAQWYFRAVKQLEDELATMTGGWEGP